MFSFMYLFTYVHAYVDIMNSYLLIANVSFGLKYRYR